MDSQVADLKTRLIREVDLFFRRPAQWKTPIISFVERLESARVPAVLFGGTPRSLLLSRIFENKVGRPRDIDIVVADVALEYLEAEFSTLISRRTRFGGLQIRHEGWDFDVWPVQDTWAFKTSKAYDAGFPQLPSTTTFNLEAVAVDAWSCSAERGLFADRDQFFHGVLSETIELNHSETPFPELTVLRGLLFASYFRFGIGPRLSSLIYETASAMTSTDFETTQYAHYGKVRIGGRTLKELTALVESALDSGEERVQLPPIGQLMLWDNGGPGTSERATVNIHVLAG